MDVYSFSNYKLIIRARVKFLSDKKKKLVTLRDVADHIDIQYTYFSKVLNQVEVHLNEEHLFGVCRFLQMNPDEIDFTLLLRSFDVAQGNERRQFIQKKIEKMRRAREINSEIQEFASEKLGLEMDFLFDPYSVVVAMALTIKEYLETPTKLCPLIGIDRQHLKQIIKRLKDLGLIEMSHGQPQKVIRTAIHYGADHPLVRVHQSLLRNVSGIQLNKTPEESKQCFMMTLSSDRQTLEKVKSRFQVFLKEIDTYVKSAQEENVFQMNFEFFKWL